jgi:hypothetical protein
VSGTGSRFILEGSYGGSGESYGNGGCTLILVVYYACGEKKTTGSGLWGSGVDGSEADPVDVGTVGSIR